jgi:hypothetical protein
MFFCQAIDISKRMSLVLVVKSKFMLCKHNIQHFYFFVDFRLDELRPNRKTSWITSEKL